MMSQMNYPQKNYTERGWDPQYIRLQAPHLTNKLTNRAVVPKVIFNYSLIIYF